MGDEWRVSLIFGDHSGSGPKPHDSMAVRDVLRSRCGDDIAVSADKNRVFLYAGTVDAAEWAERVARQVLAWRNLSADFRLERWDPSGQVWQDARAGAPDRAVVGGSAAQEEKPRRGRLRSVAGALAGEFLNHFNPLLGA